MQRSSVDLPLPDAPMMQVTSPALTVKSTSRKTTWVAELVERVRTYDDRLRTLGSPASLPYA